MNGKKIIFLVLAGIIVLSSVSNAFAENESDGSVVGEGNVEAILDMSVYRAEFPTITSDALHFTIDPQGVMDSFNHGGPGAVYFLDNASDITKSGDITVKNKSSFAADVIFTIELITPGINLVENEADLADAKVPSLYMAITDGNETKALSELTYFSTTLDRIDYKVYASATQEPGYTVGQSGNYYAYLPVNASDSNDATFNIIGKCDTSSDWSSITNVESTIKITWELKEHEE